MNELTYPAIAARIRSRRAPLLSAAAAAGALGALAATVLFTHPRLSGELMGPFAAVHGLLASGFLAIAAHIALMGALWPLAQVVAVIEAVAKLAGVAGLAAVLPFAQPASTGADGASAKGDGRAAVAGHELQLGAYGGYNRTLPSTLRFSQPGGTDLTFSDLEWMGESFKTEPYWGVRATWWNAKLRGVGLMFDYTHAKATAVKDQVLNQAGTRDGRQVPPREPFGTTFRKLEFTHGLNFFTLNAMFRTRLHARIAPYAGIGIGLSVPHVDTNRAGAPDEARTYSHQIAGLTFQAIGGIEWGLTRSGSFTAFTEYKLNHSSNQGELTGGGALDTDLWTHQAPVGFSWHRRLGTR